MKFKHIFLTICIIISEMFLGSCFNFVKTDVVPEDEILKIRNELPYSTDEEKAAYNQALLRSLFDNLPPEDQYTDNVTGNNYASTADTVDDYKQTEQIYVFNKNTKKFHKASCSSSSQIKEKNYGESGDRSWLVSNGYQPCKQCKP